MAHHTRNNWWHRNHLQCWKYPELPTKKELIYRVFRAAYPYGAFVDDNLKLVELVDKDVIWAKLEAQLDEATRGVDGFVAALCAEEPRLRGDARKHDLLRRYYLALCWEARESLWISQNGRYFEFRCMEELLVRYRRDCDCGADADAWKRKGKPLRPRPRLPPVAALRFAEEHLELKDGSELEQLEWEIGVAEGKTG
ncbi:hypothetical protein AAE478_001247 [Parahypoxylon ruwenzoriense]